MCWQPCLHEAVGKVDLIEMDLEGDEEESIPKHGIRIALKKDMIDGHYAG